MRAEGPYRKTHPMSVLRGCTFPSANMVGTGGCCILGGRFPEVPWESRPAKREG
jgi:hypothetical protein